MRTAWPLSLLAAGLLACGDTTTAPVARPRPLANLAATPSRAMSGRCSTSYVVSNLVFLPPPNDNVLVSFTATHTGSCVMTHLGVASLVKTETVVLDPNGGHVRDGVMTFTAPNADQLWATESSDIVPPDATGAFSATGFWTFTGGTGRFEGASGRVDWNATGSIVTSTTERSFRGWITY